MASVRATWLGAANPGPVSLPQPTHHNLFPLSTFTNNISWATASLLLPRLHQ